MSPEQLQQVTIGLFSLGGVSLGALLTPITQLCLEKKREQRAANRAKLLIAGEILQAQMVLGAALKGKHWPTMEDMNALLPTAAWQENKSMLIGHVSQDLWNQLVSVYTLLECDRQRFVLANKLSKPTLLPKKEAKGLRELYLKLGRLRRQLGGSGGFLDEFDELNDELDELKKKLN